jgi:hypothetical protein
LFRVGVRDLDRLADHHISRTRAKKLNLWGKDLIIFRPGAKKLLRNWKSPAISSSLPRARPSLNLHFIFWAPPIAVDRAAFHAPAQSGPDVFPTLSSNRRSKSNGRAPDRTPFAHADEVRWSQAWRIAMPEKLDLLDTFPSIRLSLAGGRTLSVPEEIDTPYAILLFYRGHW